MISFFICSVLLITCAHSAEALKALTSELSGVAVGKEAPEEVTVAGIPCGTGVDECPPMTVCCSGTCWFFACAEVQTEEETALAALVEKAKQKRETALAAPDEEQTVGWGSSSNNYYPPFNADEEQTVGWAPNHDSSSNYGWANRNIYHKEQTVGSAGYVTYSASAGTFADEEQAVGGSSSWIPLGTDEEQTVGYDSKHGSIRASSYYDEEQTVGGGSSMLNPWGTGNGPFGADEEQTVGGVSSFLNPFGIATSILRHSDFIVYPLAGIGALSILYFAWNQIIEYGKRPYEEIADEV